MFFNPGLNLNGPMLYMDLDIIIFKNIDHLFDYCVNNPVIVYTWWKDKGDKQIDIHDFRINMEPSNAGKSNLYTRTQNILNAKEGGLKFLLQSNPNLFSACNESQKFMFTKKELSAKAEGITQENNLIRDMLGSKFCDTSINTCSEIDTQEVAKIIAKIIEILQKR